MNAKKLSLVMTVVAAIGGVACAATPDESKRSAIRADNNGAPSPNDPPTYEEDDPGEQGEPVCVPGAVTPMRGWVTHANAGYSFQTPEAWKVTFEMSGSTDPAEGKFSDQTEVTLKIATGAGFFVRVGERFTRGGTPADGIAEMNAFPSTMPPSTTCVVNDTSEGIYRCDPVGMAELSCESFRGTTNVWWRFIYHGDRVFEAWCSGTTGVEDQAATCARVLDSVQVGL